MTINVAKLGRVDYPEALVIQEKLRQLRQQNVINDTLILLEHPPVLTLGVRGGHANILISEEYLKAQGVAIYKVKRGGDVTYHGPGQIVGYPIFNLMNHGKDLQGFVEKLKNVFIRLLKDEYGIAAVGGDKKLTGVWVGDEKITSIGLSFSRWISMHGFAFNVNTNLEHFKWINPCGFTDRGVTSLQKLLGKKLDIEGVNHQLVQYFSEVFDTSVEYVGQKWIDQVIGG
ncbi:MAG: lipoyl(octanoyl) transferase LipB [Dehalobacterium sp.]